MRTIFWPVTDWTWCWKAILSPENSARLFRYTPQDLVAEFPIAINDGGLIDPQEDADVDAQQGAPLAIADGTIGIDHAIDDIEVTEVTESGNDSGIDGNAEVQGPPSAPPTFDEEQW